MVKEIVKDVTELSNPLHKVEINENVTDIINDLCDTAKEHIDRCVGLAANQIGYNKRVVLVMNDFDNKKFMPMINPIITKHYGKKYMTSEGCMSLEGERYVQRYEGIEVMFRGANGKINKMKCKGFFAEIIQHEIDHCNGVLI